MDPAIVARLVELNRTFYDAFAGEFSASRRRLHDGIVEVFRCFDAVETLLDVGCGDGRVGFAWRDGELAVPWRPGRSRYLGIDNAAGLLAARATGDPLPDGLEFLPFDLVTDAFSRIDWCIERRFDAVVSFSVLHHLPGDDARHAVARGLRDVLAPDGRWAVSVWQIRDHPRFSGRLRPWSEAGFDPADLDPNDLLVDWRQGGLGYRYVHHFDENELVNLLESNGLSVHSVWRSDGRSGDLGLYVTGGISEAT